MGSDDDERTKGERSGARAFLFDADGTDRQVDPGNLAEPTLDDRQLLWVDADARDEHLHEIAAALEIDEGTLERLGAPPARPSLEDLEGYFHLNCRFLGDDPEHDRPMDIHCVVGRNWVFTTHRDDIDLIEAFLEPIKGETELGRVEGPVFLALLLDWIVSGYYRAIDQVEGRLDEIDESLILRGVQADAEEGLLGRLVGIRRDVTVLRRSLAAHREMLATLAQPEFDKVSGTGSAERFQLLSERLDKALIEIENARLMVMGSFDVLMTRTAQRTNDVMKILTVINAVLLPSLVAAAILGMNFRQSFFERRELFWVVIVAMVALGAAILAFARRKRWI
ncbi:MAG TPA: CorA family divalent cation transporter [Actinomycetota bacterium]|nr:CorA family divalent cation transporter [Actinomycetota bacterium]